MSDLEKGHKSAIGPPSLLNVSNCCSSEILGFVFQALSNSKVRDLEPSYRTIRLQFGYGFESCYAKGPRNVKKINPYEPL